MKKLTLSVSVSSLLSVCSSIELDSPSIFQNVIYNFKFDSLEGRAVFQYNGYLNTENKFEYYLEFIDIEFLNFNGREIKIGYKIPEWDEFKKSYESLFGKDIYDTIKERFKAEVDEAAITEHIKRRLLCS